MIWQMPVVLVALLAWLSAPSSSLAESARKEAVRRMLTAQSSVSVSNDTLPRPWAIDVAAEPDAVSSAPDASGAADDGENEKETVTTAAPAAAVPPAASSESAPQENGEQAWRDRVRSIRTAISDAETQASALQSRIAGLQRDVVSRDDPAQRAVLQDELMAATSELSRAQARAEEARAKLQKLREDARRQGVPPGWLR